MSQTVARLLHCVIGSIASHLAFLEASRLNISTSTAIETGTVSFVSSLIPGEAANVSVAIAGGEKLFPPGEIMYVPSSLLVKGRVTLGAGVVMMTGAGVSGGRMRRSVKGTAAEGGLGGNLVV